MCNEGGGVSVTTIERLNMIKIKAWFEDTTVIFSCNQFYNTNTIDYLAQLHLKHEGSDPLVCEVEWEIV